ncbi:MAG: hypothetical protein K2O92_09370 [Lachnospiraceae bacterium]|nr:hypothetical protein [Lachnospiraceae bacterium]
MCVAIEEMRMDSKLEGEVEGEIKGAVKTCQNFNMPLQETIQYIFDNYNLSLKESEEKVMKYWKE